MNKLYALRHKRKSEYKFFPNEEMNLVQYMIGVFIEEKHCHELIEYCKKQPGFKDHPDGFYIEAFYLDSLFNPAINDMQDILVKKEEECPEYVYLLYYEEYEQLEEGEDEDSDFGKLLAIFSTEKKAKQARKQLLSEPTFNGKQKNLNIYSQDINSAEWLEGFSSARERVGQAAPGLRPE